MNLPNKLSMLRIILAPVFLFFLIYNFVPYHALWALLVFLVASYTDHLDGKIARARGIVTSFGQFLDPLADKVLIVSALVCFSVMRLCSVWVPLIVLLREFSVTSLRLVAVESGKVIAANRWGKMKTVSQIIASGYLLAIEACAGFGLFGNVSLFTSWLSTGNTIYGGLLLFGNVLLWVSCVLTIVSGVIYIRDNREVIRNVK